MNQRILGLLFGGLTDPTALDVAIELSTEDNLGYLALNRNLSSAQITSILNKTGQLQRVKSTDYLGAAVMIASRDDLTSEHIASILMGKNSVLRQALLLRERAHHPLPNLTREIVQQVAKEHWFNDDWAKHLNHIINEAHFLLIGKLPYDKPNQSYTQSSSTHQQRIRFITNVRTSYCFKYFHNYFQPPTTPEIEEAQLERIKAQFAIPMGRESRPIYYAEFGELLQSEIGAESPSFYEIFFTTLPSWEGSLLELIATSRSLATCPS